MERQSINSIILTGTKVKSLRYINPYRRCKHYKKKLIN